jgi:3-phosphoshikimate 1-carboxyvinyltransferase
MKKITIPASKSQTMRALLFGALGSKKTQIYSYLESPDTDAMIKNLINIGCEIEIKNNQIEILGIANTRLKKNNLHINAGNSGLIFRLLGGVLALFNVEYILDGDNSIKNNRKIVPLIDALNCLGAQTSYLEKSGFAPVKIKGPINAGIVKMCGKDSQPVSAILIACSFLNEISTIYVTDAGEMPWIDLTIHWIRKLGGKIENYGYEKYLVYGGLNYKNFNYQVPGDFSSAAFPIVAALITKTPCIIENLNFGDLQGDKKLVDILTAMGANLEKDKLNQRLIIHPSSNFKGGIINVNDIIDAVPILAVMGCFCISSLTLTNCQIARFKESNRLAAITSELQKMGANISYDDDSVTVFPSKLNSAKVKSYHDHRIAMALCVAALKVENKGFEIDDLKCIEKSYPNFLTEIEKFK